SAHHARRHPPPHTRTEWTLPGLLLRGRDQGSARLLRWLRVAPRTDHLGEELMTALETILTPTVLIIGGGPAGLRAAAELAPRVSGEVLVVERESEAGGIPRHSDHPGYGMRDMGKFISGPRYARILRTRAQSAGARIMTSTMVTEWAGEHE